MDRVVSSIPTHFLTLVVLVLLFEQLNLDGPPTSLDLFGIQVTSHLNTKRASLDIGPVNEHTRYLVENALVAEN